MRFTRMGGRVGILAACLLAGAAGAQTEWQLVWQDEFDGPDIDGAKWEHMIGDGTAYGLPRGWGNNELQYYTSRIVNSYVLDGTLNIVALEERYNGSNYTSARLRTKGLEEVQYGRVEARMRVPFGQGLWAAFWMLPTDSPYGGWAASGEIDVVETINIPLQAHGTIHFGGSWPNNTQNGGSITPGVDLSDDFHVYAIEWAPDRITWFLDDVPYHTATSAVWWSENGGGNPRAPFDNPFHMLLNVAVGGNWPGPPDATTEFPQRMQVDWVRVSQPVQTPFGGDAHVVPGRIEAEAFDEGWPEQAYADSDIGNSGGAFRPEGDVDIEVCGEGGFNVGWIREGEWLEYTIDVPRAGTFLPRARVASQQSGGRFSLSVDGVDRTGAIDVPATGNWQAWRTVAGDPIWLPPGEHVVRWTNLGDDTQQFNLNWIDFVRVRPGIRQIEAR